MKYKELYSKAREEMLEMQVNHVKRVRRLDNIIAILAFFMIMVLYLSTLI